MRKFIPIGFFIFFIAISNISFAQKEKSETEESIKTLADFVKSLKFSGQWFLAYQNGDVKDKTFNEFKLKRGYITFQKTFNEMLSARFTQDVTVDKEGDGVGDIELRLKYIYLKYKIQDLGFLSKPYFEVGLVHRPWLDFEQKVNRYRVQGKMYLERSGILSSADYGVAFFSYFGGEMDKKYKSTVNKSYAGKYGSFGIGIFNGGGYHALENNENKIIETRLTIRPVPFVIPGLQVSYLGLFGKGNSEAAPDYTTNTGVLSYESKHFTGVATLYNGTGNINGSAINENKNSLDQNGYSIFGEVKFGEGSKLALFGRYDFFEQEVLPTNIEKKTLVLGLSYSFLKGSKILIDYDKIESSIPGKPDDSFLELAIELKY